MKKERVMASKSKAKAKPASKKPAPVKPATVKAAAPAKAAKPSPKPKPAAKPRPVINMPGQPTRWPREIEIGARHRKDMGDLAALARSIDERGALLQPIVITPTNKLIAGQRRLEAWKLSRFKKEAIPVCVVDIDAIVLGERDENAQRKDFTPTEAVAIKREIEEILKARADARPAAMRAAPGRKAEDGGRAADKAAGYVGKDRRTIEKAERIIEAAERDPERFGGLVEDMNRTGRVDGPFKRLENIQSGDRIRAEPPPPPMHGPYRTLVIDFPWPADLDGYRDQAARGYYPYATMAMEQIVAYAAEQVAPILHDEGAAVWLWIPNFHLVRGCHTAVLKALGVEGSTMLTWVKPEIGQGQRLRGATEHAILAVKGKVPVLGHEQRTWFDAPGGKAHSAKPQAFFDIVETVTPAPRYAFLFAGGSVPENWDGHGDRIGKQAEGEGEATEGTHSDAHNPEPELAPAPEITELQALETIEAGREIDIKLPIVTTLKGKKYARGSVKLKLTKLGMVRLEALRQEAYEAHDAPVVGIDGGAADGDQAQEEISQVDCRVCSAGDGVCAECIAAADHVISVGFDAAADPVQYIARCSCGFNCQADDIEEGYDADSEVYPTPPTVAAAIKAHWQNVVTEAHAAAASVADAEPHAPAADADLDIPENLRRGPDGLAPYQRSEAAE